MTSAAPLAVEGILPSEAAAGTATLILQPPKGPASLQHVEIRRTAPGLFSVNGIPKGIASDNAGNLYPIATCTGNVQCVIAILPLSSTPGGLDFVLYGTGLRNETGTVRLLIGTHTLRATGVRASEIAGVDEIRFHLPQDFPLHLYQSIAVQTAEGVSNHLFIYLE
jgi:uncharacterized protein (TIGR03437 family)